MKAFSVLLVCTLVACCVWMVQARNIKVKTDDEDAHGIVKGKDRLPGVCWVCKWALDKVKKALGKNTTAQIIQNKLNAICDQIGFLKSLCRKFIRSHLAVLVEELSTTDNVRRICVNVKACKRKELLGQPFDESEEDFNMEIDEFDWENQN